MIVDLFGGAGGWSEGLRTLGLHDIGIEIDRWACATRAAANHLTIRADVAQYPPEVFAGRVEGLIASPPCQMFSRAGQRAGHTLWVELSTLVRDAARGGEVEPHIRPMVELLWPTLSDVDRKGRPISEAVRRAKAEGQVRNAALVAQPGRWAQAIMPRWVALEQVEEVLPLWEVLAGELRRLGYSTWTGVLCAADYGVPQTRERAFLLAHRERAALPPEPTHCRGGRPPGLFVPELLPWVSMADALGWPVPGWTWVNGNQSHAARRRPDEPAPTIHFGHALNEVAWVAERPASTIVGSYGRGRVAAPGHHGNSTYEQPEAVRVSIEEAAILQGFRPDYPWRGSKTKRFAQVGQAVPPPMAAAIVGGQR